MSRPPRLEYLHDLSGAYRQAHMAQGPFFHPKDVMRHNRDISGAWTTFVLDKSEDFTQAGVKRLNDSIRRYVWAILGAQAQTRSNILIHFLFYIFC